MSPEVKAPHHASSVPHYEPCPTRGPQRCSEPLCFRCAIYTRPHYDSPAAVSSIAHLAEQLAVLSANQGRSPILASGAEGRSNTTA